MTIKLPFRKLAAAALFVSTDETRVVLTGVRIEPKPYGVLIIGCDGRRIVFIRHEIEALDETLKGPILIPAALINRLGVRLADETFFDEEGTQERQCTNPPWQDCTVSVFGLEVSIRLEGSHGVIGNLLEPDRYPPTAQVIPTTPIEPYKVASFSASFMADYEKACRWLSGDGSCSVLAAGHQRVHGGDHAGIYSVRMETCPDFYSVLMPVKVDNALVAVAVPDWLKA